MKKIVLLLCILFISTPCFAGKDYIFIDKKSPVEAIGDGHNRYQEVIAILPVTDQNEPTRAELSMYQIIIDDGMTDQEKADLLAPGVSNERNLRMDLSILNVSEQLEEVDHALCVASIIQP